MMTTFSHTYDVDTPAGSDDPAEADDRMQEIKAAVQERENVDHYWPKTGTEVSHADVGEHRKVTLRTGSAPTKADDKGFVYAKDVSGKAELFYRDEDGDEIQITTGGILNSLNLTGAQTAAGVKTFSSIPKIPTTAPTVDAEVAGKKYVNDQITANQDSTYSGGESHTFKGGLIWKQGSTSVGANTTKAVTFGTAFSTECTRVFVSYGSQTIWQSVCSVTTKSKTGFSVRNNSTGTNTVSWFAIGY